MNNIKKYKSIIKNIIILVLLLIICYGINKMRIELKNRELQIEENYQIIETYKNDNASLKEEITNYNDTIKNLNEKISKLKAENQELKKN